MFRLLNVALVIGVIACSFVMYSLEHQTRKTERQIAGLQQDIRQERENIRLLKAEWSHLTRPARLERLARKHLQLEPMRPEQLVRQAELAAHLPERPVFAAPADGEDAIGNMLKALE
jgi:cell division protein FtsL